MRLKCVVLPLCIFTAVASANSPRESARDFAADIARREIRRLVLVLATAPEHRKPSIRNQIHVQQAILDCLAEESK